MSLIDPVCRLTNELTEAEQYRDAYFNVLHELEVLVQRNALAEEEAQRLSKFNAEIVGHNNPAQRIVYLDKIRRELHETKQVRASLVAEGNSFLTGHWFT